MAAAAGASPLVQGFAAVTQPAPSLVYGLDFCQHLAGRHLLVAGGGHARIRRYERATGRLRHPASGGSAGVVLRAGRAGLLALHPAQRLCRADRAWGAMGCQQPAICRAVDRSRNGARHLVDRFWLGRSGLRPCGWTAGFLCALGGGLRADGAGCLAGRGARAGPAAALGRRRPARSGPAMGGGGAGLDAVHRFAARHPAPRQHQPKQQI